MKGYVKNIGMVPVYILKGTVNCNDTISFDTLLDRFGDVADTKNEKTFADWLLENKFMNKNVWEVVVDDSEVEQKNSAAKKEIPKEESKVTNRVTIANKEIIRKAPSAVAKKLTIDYIIDTKITEMKLKFDKIKDVKLLKKALKKAEGMSKKATLCNRLRDRITELTATQ